MLPAGVALADQMPVSIRAATPHWYEGALDTTTIISPVATAPTAITSRSPKTSTARPATTTKGNAPKFMALEKNPTWARLMPKYDWMKGASVGTPWVTKETAAWLNVVMASTTQR